MRITINEDTAFLISDDLGDVPEGAELGLYQDDTRYLCRYEMTLNGEHPLPLAAHATDYYAATNILTNPALVGVLPGVLSIVRQRTVGHGMHEDLDVTNHGDDEATFSLGLRLDADFAHIFEVKQAMSVEKEAARRSGDFSVEVAHSCDTVRFHYRRGDVERHMVVGFSETPTVADGRYSFGLRLAPGETWHLCINFLTREGGPMPECGRARDSAFAEHREHVPTASVLRAPRLETDSFVLQQAYAQSVLDFAALRIKGRDISDGEFMLAAGIPWYMALFGRDSLIAAYQALPFYPLLARGVLRALARFQGMRVDRVSAEEPGKILHEHRPHVHAELTNMIPAFPYFGTIDATPLFLILLAAVYRVTGDLEFVRSLRQPAERALEWIERYGDRDGDGYVEYIRDADAGLENQGWKDSHDSVRFHSGAIAQPPIALCEVQGYTYAAWLGMAELFDALGERDRATTLRRRAGSLKARFNRDFWLPERGFYAEALDGEKRPVDSLTSNVGHLLWCGIADGDKAHQVAERLLSPEMFSGWGIRTMANTDGGYNPISYHNGSIWPHDTGLIVAGLARYGFVDEAVRVVDGLVAALSQYGDHRLPELFAGYGAREVSFVVEYPTASRPQAWASGTVFLLISAMLGVTPQVAGPAEATHPFLPSGIKRLCVDGISLERRTVAVEVVGSGEQVRRRIDEYSVPPSSSERRLRKTS